MGVHQVEASELREVLRDCHDPRIRDELARPKDRAACHGAYFEDDNNGDGEGGDVL